jgi:hypothetical protein
LKRASAKITLVLAGAALLHGCGRDVETRDVYLTRNDCVHDWGDESKCEADSTGGSRFYYGPGYAGARGAPTPRGESRAVSSQSTVRGGFGSSASSHASSGG